MLNTDSCKVQIIKLGKSHSANRIIFRRRRLAEKKIRRQRRLRLLRGLVERAHHFLNLKTFLVVPPIYFSRKTSIKSNTTQLLQHKHNNEQRYKLMVHDAGVYCLGLHVGLVVEI